MPGVTTSLGGASASSNVSYPGKHRRLDIQYSCHCIFVPFLSSLSSLRASFRLDETQPFFRITPMKYISGWCAVTLLLAFCMLAAQASESRLPPVKIIFDTDIGNDVDDVLALSILHSLQARADCQLLAITITKP